MIDFEIVVGSMLGASEYVADALQEALNKHDLSSNIHLAPDLNDVSRDATWIICTSTHGAGDLPDNIQPFAKQIAKTDTSDVTFIVIGLGDSSYDTFCFGAAQMEKVLKNSGARMDAPALNIDVLHHPIPEQTAVDWLETWLSSRG